MKFKKGILTGIGALVFLTVLALNVHLVNSSQLESSGFASLFWVEIAVQAQTEDGCDCEPNEQCIDGICYPISDTNNGLIDVRPCPDGGFWYTCGGTGNNCGTDDC